MNILTLCECSGKVRDAFRKLGHNAWSCDIQKDAKDSEFHYKMDAFEAVNILHWDMIIAFPPCTHIATSGAAHFAKKRADGRQQDAIEFFMKIANLNVPKLVIENPVGIMSTNWRKPDQIIQPYQFGDQFQKTTCLWLKGVPKLVPTKIVDKGEFLTFKSGKRMAKWMSDLAGKGDIRSITFDGIATAMATQWSNV